MSRATVATIALGVLGGLVATIGMEAGWWWLTFAVALVIGLLAARRGRSLAAGALVGIVGWGLPLLVLALTGAPVGRAAVVLSSILGAAAGGVPALVLTLLTGVLLGLAGTWLGSALRLRRRRS